MESENSILGRSWGSALDDLDLTAGRNGSIRDESGVLATVHLFAHLDVSVDEASDADEAIRAGLELREALKASAGITCVAAGSIVIQNHNLHGR